jgi:uncharacterized protein YukE
MHGRHTQLIVFVIVICFKQFFVFCFLSLIPSVFSGLLYILSCCMTFFLVELLTEEKVADMSSIPAATEDHNAALLHASERIHKLTAAADALVARDFILAEKDSVLNELERYIAVLEADVQDAESMTASVRTRCALLRPGIRGSTVGESAEVMTLWRQHGASMARLLKRHSTRLVELEEAFAAVPEDNETLPSALSKTA